MAVPFAFEFCFQFDMHRFDSLLVEMLSRHCTRDLRDFSVPLTHCIRKGLLQFFLSLVYSINFLNDLPSRLKVFDDVPCVLKLNYEPLADCPKPSFETE